MPVVISVLILVLVIIPIMILVPQSWWESEEKRDRRKQWYEGCEARRRARRDLDVFDLNSGD